MIASYLITLGFGAVMVWFFSRINRPLPGGNHTVKQRSADEINPNDTYEG